MAQLTFLETFSEQVLNTKNEPESSNSVILGKNLGQKITFKKRRIYNPITLKFNSLNKILNKHRMNNNNVIAQFREYFSIIIISGKSRFYL